MAAKKVNKSKKKKMEHINLSVTPSVFRDITKLSVNTNKRDFCRHGVNLLIRMNKLRDEGCELALVKNGKIVTRLFEL